MPTWTTGGYTWPGYNPMGQPTPRPALADAPAAEPSAITAGQKRCAKLAGASHLAHDGYYCYRWNGSRIESKQWYGERYSMNWLDTGKGELPAGAVKVE